MVAGAPNTQGDASSTFINERSRCSTKDQGYTGTGVWYTVSTIRVKSRKGAATRAVFTDNISVDHIAGQSKETKEIRKTKQAKETLTESDMKAFKSASVTFL